MDRPLTALFIDCDSFFASVEQHLDPALRGRPVGVAPVMAETSCCIAASYEAKAFGVKTGTRISDAWIMCPGIVIVESKPPEYIKIHHRIIEASARLREIAKRIETGETMPLILMDSEVRLVGKAREISYRPEPPRQSATKSPLGS